MVANSGEKMFVYFEFEQEYRKKMADCFDVRVEKLDEFFSDLESEVGWYISLGGLRNSGLSAKEALAYLEQLSENSRLLLEHLEKMPRNILGWVVEAVPMGVNYREPFKKILPLLQQITQFTSDATGKVDPEVKNISQVDSMDLVKRLGRCYDDYSETPINMQTKLFEKYVKIVFDAMGTDDDPKQIIQKTLNYKREKAALAAKNAAPVQPKRKPLGRRKNKTEKNTGRSR